MMSNSPVRYFLITIVAVLVLFVGYSVWNQPDQRDAGQKISDAVNDLPNGVDKAARQLENRTPGDKVQDAAHDVKNDIKDATK